MTGNIWSKHSMPCKSPLKYVGGKGKMLDHIIPYIPETTDVIIEPFCGSAALSFSQDKPFYLSDMSPELINFMKELRDNPYELYTEAVKLSQSHSKEFYLEARQWDRLKGFSTSQPCTRNLRAARYLYIIYYGFNGLYRVNQKGYCNTPYGGDNRKYPDDIEQMLKDASKHLNTWCKGIFCQEFDDMSQLESIIDSGNEVFIFIDPPYEEGDNGKKVFQEYTSTKIDNKFTDRLVNYLESLDAAGVPFLMTNTSCKYVKETYNKWNIKNVPVNYIVGADKERTGNKFEMFVSNTG